MFRDYVKSLKQAKYPLPPRDDVMEFNVQTNIDDLEKNLKPQGLSSDLQEKVKEVVTKYWDIFCEDGFRWYIRRFSFQIETCSHSPICCKHPRYVPQEY